MKKLFFTILILICCLSSYAQHTLKLSIIKEGENTSLSGATAVISSINKTAIADSLGIVTFTNIAGGVYNIKISYAGLEEQQVKVMIPYTQGVLEILMEEGEEAEEEVIIMSTRTSRWISDIPTRVETISGEELTEKGNMKPGDIRMLLNESTGIQTQQTSATSYNSSIRIQGLDGRYTQLLRDGFPLYAGFSGGLSLMQIAPLDLKQVEVIKGASSTLYGGGAIAGLINLITKTPGEKRELSFIANVTSAIGLDFSGFYSQKFKKIGLTVFGSRNSAAAYDPADIGLTAIPKSGRYTINPRLFIYAGKTNANIGVSYINEKRTGGSMKYILNGTPGFFEKNQTNRFTVQADILHKLSDNSDLQFKNSYTNFSRLITIPTYMFEGVQQSSFSELNFSTKTNRSLWIAGANFLTDDLNEKRRSSTTLRNYHHKTIGVFVQNTWIPSGSFSVETGLRGDYVKQYGFELLPRVAVMLKITPQLTARLGGGLGYKTPTVFNEESEKVHLQNILPINQPVSNNERSTGGNFDLNYRAEFGEIGFTVNQLFFYTKLNKPLVLTITAAGNNEFINATGFIDTRGMETNLRFTYKDFKLFVGYTFADVNSHFNNSKKSFPLTAKHRLNNVLMYEGEGKLKIGFEAYYFSPQKLTDGSQGKAYWINGLMAEQQLENFSIFINFENMFDTRQTKFDTIYIGTLNNPIFRDIYAPVDGFVVNGGIKINL